MHKRGIGNIEFILSFILFIGFVVAAIYFFNPVRSTKAIQSSADYTIDEIISNTSVEVDSYSVKIDNAAPSGKIAIRIPEIGPEKKARAENYSGAKLNSGRENDFIYVDRNNEGFLVIYFSEDIEPGNAGSIEHNSNYYKIASSSSNDSLISEKRIRQLNESYYRDYESLKKERGIPPGIGFSFSLEFSDGGKISGERNIPLRAEIFSEIRRVEILRSDGKREFANLNIKIW